MAVETERKLTVASEAWRDEVASTSVLRQGYLTTEPRATVRVRVVDDEQAFVTIKGARVRDTRPEYEYGIPVADAVEMLRDLCTHPPLEKIRHTLRRTPGLWVVDEFLGVNAGLVVAEVEFDQADGVPEFPAWAALDVTEDDSYANSQLYTKPYTTW